MENSKNTIAHNLRWNLSQLLWIERSKVKFHSTMYKRINAAYRMHASTPIDQVIMQIPVTVYAKMQANKKRLYSAGKYQMDPPPVFTGNWTAQGWINYIDAYGYWSP